MKVIIEIELGHEPGTAEAPAERVAEAAYAFVRWETVDAGLAVGDKWVAAKYHPRGFRFVGSGG